MYIYCTTVAQCTVGSSMIRLSGHVAPRMQIHGTSTTTRIPGQQGEAKNLPLLDTLRNQFLALIARDLERTES
jgi:hypothetical protein